MFELYYLFMLFLRPVARRVGRHRYQRSVQVQRQAPPGYWGRLWEGPSLLVPLLTVQGNKIKITKIIRMKILSFFLGLCWILWRSVFICLFQAPSHVYGGHSSHVTNVTFLFDDSYLVSTGGKDMSVLQWKIVWDRTEAKTKLYWTALRQKP